MSPAENKAVFLSYASQDAEAAKRVCGALRAAGAEVWFDQSELVGGDAWDAKIRKQIADCALFVPVISAATQARGEGYFRIEWRLAAQRTHAMSDDTTFLLPVVIDDTRDADARVPAEFRAVQWTRLPGGETPEKFCARVKQLLGGEVAPASSRQSDEAGKMPALPRKQSSRPWLGLAIVVVVVAAALAIWQPWKKSTPAPAPTPAPSSPLAKGWEVDAKGIDASQDELLLAESLAQRELERNPAATEAYALLSRINSTLYRHHEPTAARKEAAASFASKALSLAANDRRARLAQGRAYLLDTATLADGQEGLRKLAAESPADPEVLLACADSLIYAEEEATVPQNTEAIALFDRVLKLRPFDALAMYGKCVALWNLGRLSEAEALVSESIARHGNSAALFWKFWIITVSRNDPVEARRVIEQFPADLRRNPMAVRIVSMFWLTQREPEKALGWLTPFPREFIRDKNLDTPKGYLVGKAHAQAGRLEAARLEWRNALDAVERRLQGEPQSASLVAFKARLQALLGDNAAAARTAELFRQLAKPASDPEIDSWIEAFSVAMDTGDVTRATQMVEAARKFLLTLPATQVGPRLQTLATRLGRYQVIYPAGGDTAEYHALLKSFTPAPPPVVTQKADVSAAALAKADDKSVAVLAFANLSDDKANEYFSDGISEELLNVLAKIPGLKVSARTSAFHFKGKDTPIPEIARQLGVAYVVEGSVRKSGTQVRITAQLIKAADGFHVWSDRFTRELKDVFAVQDEIAGLIAKTLSLKLGTGAAVSSGTVNPEAFRLYLEGRKEWNRRSMAGYQRAEVLLSQAIELEPGFARAHAALADVWNFSESETLKLGAYRLRNAPELARIFAKSDQALALDPNCAEAYAARSHTLQFAWRLDEDLAALRRAVALNPNYATARQWLGGTLQSLGYVDEALVEYQLAAELDPLSHRILDNYSDALVLAGRMDEAGTILGRARALNPEGRQIAVKQAMLLTSLRRRGEAIAAARALVADDSADMFDYRCMAAIDGLVTFGERAEAERLLPKIMAGTSERVVALISLGRTTEGLASLDDIDLGFVDTIRMDPKFAQVRAKPEFVAWLKKVGLTDAQQRLEAWWAAHPPAKK